MLTLKDFISLLEAKIDDYKTQETNIGTEHDPNGPLKNPHEIIDHFHSHNPTGDINHTKWVVNQYKKGAIKQEDAPMMKDVLTKFNKYKEKMPKKQLSQYKDIGELNTALHGMEPNKTDEKSVKEEETIKNGSTLVHSSPSMKLYHVHNKEASRVLGKGMPWCTSRMDKDNMFDHYNSESNRKFYIAHMHNENFPYRKIGIARNTDELQDENNEHINGDKLNNLVSRNPEIKKIPELQGHKVALTDDPRKHIHDLIENDPDGLHEHMESHPHLYNEQHHKIVNDYYEQSHKADRGDPTVINSRYISILKKLARNGMDKRLLDKLADHEHQGVRSEVASNSYAHENTLKKLLNDKEPIVRGSVNLDGVNDESIHDAIKKENNQDILDAMYNKLSGHEKESDFAKDFVNNKNSSDEVLHNNMEHLGKRDKLKLLDHPNAGKKVLVKTAIDNESPELSRKLLGHKGMSDLALRTLLRKGHITDDEALNHPESEKIVIGHIINYGKMTPELKNKLLKHKNIHDTNLKDLYETGHITADEGLSHPKAGQHLMYSIANNPNTSTTKKILNNDNTTDSIIKKLYEKKLINAHEALSHKNAGNSTINKVLENEDKLSPEAKKSLLNNKNVDDEHLQNAHNAGHISAQEALDHPNSGEKTIESVILNKKNKTPEIKEKLLNHKSLSDEHLKEMYYGGHITAGEGLNHSKSGKHMVNGAANYFYNLKQHEKDSLLKHKNMTHYYLNGLYKKGDISPEQVINNKKSNGDSIDEIIHKEKNMSPELKNSILGHKDLSHEHLYQMHQNSHITTPEYNEHAKRFMKESWVNVKRILNR